MGYRESVRALVRKALPDLAEVGPKEGGAVVFCNDSRTRFLSFEPWSGPNHLALTFSDAEGHLSEEHGWQGGRRQSVEPFLKRADLHNLERWVIHYAEHHQLIDLDDHFLDRFCDAKAPTREEVARARQTLSERFCRQFCCWSGVGATTEFSTDFIGSVRARFSCPLGTFQAIQQGQHFGPMGRIPPFARLELDSTRCNTDDDWQALSNGWPNLQKWLDPELPLSRNRAKALIHDMFAEMSASLSSGEVLQFTSDDAEVHLQGPARTVSVNRHYAQQLNSSSAEYTALLARLGEDWRSAYDQIRSTSDPLTVLVEATVQRPKDMKTWKALAHYHAANGDPASENVALARGYVACGLPSIAKGKLQLALKHDPKHPEALELAEELGGTAR